MKLVNTEQMRSIEAACVDRGISVESLMVNAGNALGAKIVEMAPDGTILVLVGPGNNGGDGLVAAAALADRRRNVIVYAFKRLDASPFVGPTIRSNDDPDGSQLKHLVGSCSIVVDCLLGIGQSQAVEGALATIVSVANEDRGPSTRSLATDIPTGVHADTGELLGTAFRADATLCIGFAKLGAALYPGSTLAGSLQAADAGIPGDLAKSLPLSLTDPAEAAHLLPQREVDANKGSSGRLLAVCGSHDFRGAPVLASLAAYRAGAGLVELALPDRILSSVASKALEPIFLPLPDVDGKLGPSSLKQIEQAIPHAKAVVLGSGMGLSDATVSLIRGILAVLHRASGPPAVIDADGLNALAKIPEWHVGLANVVLTPHPGEMSRLTGMSIADIQRDRIGVARRYAAEWGVTLVLKGARTVVASPHGDIAINFSGGPNLATAGTGDVLTGVIGGLLAQGRSPWDAARCGAFLHGYAGDLWCAQHGDVGMLASDLLPLLPIARKSILETNEGT